MEIEVQPEGMPGISGTGTAANPRRAEFVHAEAGNSAYQSELAALLRRRLQIMATIGAFVELASTIRTAVILPGDTAHGGSLIGVLIVGTVLAILALLYLSLLKSAELLSVMGVGAVGSVFVGAYLNPALLPHRFRIIVTITPSSSRSRRSGFMGATSWRRSASRPSPRSRSGSTS